MNGLKFICPGFNIQGELIEDVQNGIALTRVKWEFGEAVAISVGEADAIRMRDWLNSRYPIVTADLVEALRLCVASLDQLLPYLAKVPADIGLLNDALVSSRAALTAFEVGE
ncbi:hypothetical protein [Stutzerimonas nitrititolerans]|uniref:hypothetical protein n=1 Tax=Stutzerimonas nitrititolerans TaxID=2482751 RepID=UPI00289A44D2|nr:hypothetical protein [Stutzerimonas nitrititolerans]